MSLYDEEKTKLISRVDGIDTDLDVTRIATESGISVGENSVALTDDVDTVSALTERNAKFSVPTANDENHAATRLISDGSPVIPRTSLESSPSLIGSKYKLAIGDVLKGRYQLLEKLGEGGMGMVFKALDLLLVETKSRNPYVAIKVLSSGLAENQVMVAALQRECEKTQSLKHDNIISVNAFDRDGDHVFISMEFLSGQALSDIIRQAKAAGAMPMPLSRAWPMISKMGSALAYAHKKNIVHRDFKPANVFVTTEGDVKVLDFGIASKIDTEIATSGADGEDMDTPTRLVSTGLTATYASVEMFRGLVPDPRDDVYAFGLVVYELLTGTHPYNRRSADEVFYAQQANNGKLGLKPINGLSRRQWLALRSALALVQSKRPKDLAVWLEKFDPAAKSSTPLLVGMGLAAMVAVGFGLKVWFEAPMLETLKIEPRKQLVSEPIKQPIATFDNSGQNSIGEANTAHSVTLPASSAIVPKESLAAMVLTDAVLSLATGKQKYKIGEAFTLNVHLDKAGYLRVANLSPAGEISEILPNPYQSIRVKKANSDFQIPPKSKNIKLQVSAPVGGYKIVAVFSESPLPEVKNIIDVDGNLISKLQSTNIVFKVINYDVVK